MYNYKFDFQQMQLRRCDSQERDKGNKSLQNSLVSESSASDMLRDLKMRRQHLENQVNTQFAHI